MLALQAAPRAAPKAPAPRLHRNVAAQGLLDNAGKKGSGNTQQPVKADDPPGRQARKAAFKAKEMATDGVGADLAQKPQTIFRRIQDFFRSKLNAPPIGDNAGKKGSGNTMANFTASDPPHRKEMKAKMVAKQDENDGKR